MKTEENDFIEEAHFDDFLSSGEGIEFMVYHLNDLKFIVGKGKKTKEWREDIGNINKLLVEIELFKEFFIPRLKAFQTLALELKIKYAFTTATKEEVQQYKDISDEKNKIKKLIPKSDKKDLEKITLLYKKSFSTNFNPKCINDVIPMLKDNKLIDRSTSPQIIKKFLALEAIPKDQRMIWTDLTPQNLESIKILVRIVMALFKKKSNKRTGFLNYHSLVNGYFIGIQNKELNSESVGPTITKILKDRSISGKEFVIANDLKRISNNFSIGA